MHVVLCTLLCVIGVLYIHHLGRHIFDFPLSCCQNCRKKPSQVATVLRDFLVLVILSLLVQHVEEEHLIFFTSCI